MTASQNKNSMARGEKTKLTKANDSSYSLRTTVPKGISNQLDLKEGDSLTWELRPNGKEFLVVVIPNKEKGKVGKK